MILPFYDLLFLLFNYFNSFSVLSHQWNLCSWYLIYCIFFPRLPIYLIYCFSFLLMLMSCLGSDFPVVVLSLYVFFWLPLLSLFAGFKFFNAVAAKIWCRCFLHCNFFCILFPPFPCFGDFLWYLCYSFTYFSDLFSANYSFVIFLNPFACFNFLLLSFIKSAVSDLFFVTASGIIFLFSVFPIFFFHQCGFIFLLYLLSSLLLILI